MFGRMMNNYYYGKSGKGDFRKDDMPETRMQLFFDTLRTRLSGLCRLNLIYAIAWIPAALVLLLNVSNLWNRVQTEAAVSQYEYTEYAELLKEKNIEVTLAEADYNAEQFAAVRSGALSDLQNSIFWTLLWLFPCIAITGPFTAGMSYVTRNWARDEHAFIWTDFKDAVKANWKIPLLLSCITGALPVLIYQGWITYGRLSAENAILVVPQMLVVLVGVLWALCITYMHPLTVTYDLKAGGVLRNGLLLGIARLPFSLGIRLLHCVPALIDFAAVWFFGLDPLLGLLLLCGYYMLIGFGLSRFITASYTNAVFDRFINPRIEGAKVNQGLREAEHFDDEEEPDADEADAGRTN